MLTQEGLDLLVVNRLNDSKEWYEEHKGEIRRLVIEPFFELITDLGQTMLSIDSEIVIEPKVDRTLSRVYRDTRFTKDKSRYRDCIWLYFRRDKNLYPGDPWFFFELRPYMAWWGCGRYTRDTSYVDATRKMIMDRDPLYLEAKRVVDDSDSYFMLEQDERYKGQCILMSQRIQETGLTGGASMLSTSRTMSQRYLPKISAKNFVGII